MDYSDTLNLWATPTHNEINFIRWKRSDCKFSTLKHTNVPDGLFLGHTFHTSPRDRIVAKRVTVSSEEERPVTVTSLNWIKKSNCMAHLVVSFLYHHVEYVMSRVLFVNCVSSPYRIIDGETKDVLTHVAIHTPVYVSFRSSDATGVDSRTRCRMSLSSSNRALVTNMFGGFIVYDLSSARVIACARDIRGLDRESPAIFSHGGCAILIGCRDGQAKLFDSESASYLQTLNHDGP